MSVGTVITLAATGAIVLFEFYRYEAIHVPRCAAVYAEFMYDKCVKNCVADQLAACAANGVPADKCVIDCSRCKIYLGEDS